MERKLPPLLLTFLLAGLMALLVSLTGGRWWAGTFLPWLSWLPLGAGLALTMAGVMAFRRAGTTVDPRFPERSAALVTTGVYRHTRNPMYAGFLLWLLGWAVWLANPWALAGCPLLVWYLNRFQIEPEERQLQARFPEEFRRYCEAVPRWL